MRKLILALAVICSTATAWADCTVTVASPTGGVNRPCTQLEELGLIDRNNAPPPPVPLTNQLNAIFEQSLAPELQADLAPLKAAVKLELDQGRANIAKLIIQRATIPVELEPLRTQMLEVFP
jgi:uncharacterized protein YfaP (DUF2135 family)